MKIPDVSKLHFAYSTAHIGDLIPVWEVVGFFECKLANLDVFFKQSGLECGHNLAKLINDCIRLL